MVVANAHSPASWWEVRRRVWVNSSMTGNDVPYLLHRNNTFNQFSHERQVWLLVFTLLIRKIHYFKVRGTKRPQGPCCRASRQPHLHHVRRWEQSWWAPALNLGQRHFGCWLLAACFCQLGLQLPVFPQETLFFGCYWGFAWPLTVVQPTNAALFPPCKRRRGCMQYFWPTRNSRSTRPW